MTVRTIKQSESEPKRVWFGGSTPLLQGMGVCYNTDYGTAKEVDGSRTQRVEMPSTSNSSWFAGVTIQKYPADSRGQWIEICEPGGVCLVQIGKDTVADTGILTCSCKGGDMGIFSRIGMPGRGSMTPLQTSTFDSGSYEQTVLARSLDGSASVGANLIITDSSAFGNVSVGDACYITAHAITATGVADATGLVGKYLVSAQASGAITVVNATAAAGHDNVVAGVAFTTASIVEYFIVPATGALCLAYLHPGAESGLQESLSIDYGSEVDTMAGGTSHINGVGTTLAGTTPAVNIVVQPVVGCNTRYKRLFTEGGIATSNGQVIQDDSVVIRKADSSAALTTLTIAAANDDATLLFDMQGNEAKLIGTDMTEG